LYAELIRNRIFKDDPKNPTHWSLVQVHGGSGAISLDETQPINSALTTSLRLDISAATEAQRVGVANDGYWGIPIKPRTRYRASFYAKAAEGFTGPLTVDIESADGATICARAEVPRLTTSWHHYSVTLTSGNVGAPDPNRFVISASHPGTVWLS